MSRVVYKYDIYIEDQFAVDLPIGALVLHAAMQDTRPFMWVEIDESRVSEKRMFAVVGTGHDVPVGAMWCATFQNTPFVWHLYELDD